MNRNFKDLTGKKFGRLTATKIVGKSKSGNFNWLCKCDCGNIKEVIGSGLKNGHTKSCGCLRRLLSSKRNSTHGMSNNLEYKNWAKMKSRCLNKNIQGYKNWGGRGITVCDRWLNSFENFFEDMGKRPIGMSIDRIDNNGNYCKENCRWATRKEQMRNMRINKMLTYKGETKCLAEWSEKLDINYHTLSSRIRYGWSVDKILSQQRSVQIIS